MLSFSENLWTTKIAEIELPLPLHKHTDLRFNQVLGLKMTRTDLHVLVDSERFSFVSTNGMEPKFFEDNVVWKLQVRNFLLVSGSVFLLDTVWHTTI